MKKSIAVFLAVLLIGTFAGCTPKPPTSSEGAPTSSNSDAFISIGVIQLIEHTALDDSYRGFVDGLKELGYEDGKNIRITYQNAQGSSANCVTIANKLVRDESDLILAIATSAGQAVATATSDIPVLITAVTDPAHARLVATNEAPGGNVTGTSDLTPIAEQIALIRELLPDAQKIGFLYSSSEDNSLFQIEIAKKEAEKLGFTFVEATVSSANEIPQVTKSLANKVDVIYVPTDNTISTAMGAVTKITAEAKIPVIGADVLMVENGAVATRGLSYYELGKQTARQAVRILAEGADPATMPIEYLENIELAINQEMAKTIGLEIPQTLLDKLPKQ